MHLQRSHAVLRNDPIRASLLISAPDLFLLQGGETVASKPEGSALAKMAVKDEATKEPLPPWEKVLWKKQPYPDNYTPHTFLSALQMNSEAGRRSLSVAHPC